MNENKIDIQYAPLGIAKLLHTTNSNFTKYENRRGEFIKVQILDSYFYYFDMTRYFLKTSYVRKVEYIDSGIHKSKMIVTTQF